MTRRPEAVSPTSASSESDRKELLSALAGREANRTCAIAFRTCRVVRTSAGVISDQKACSKRSRAVAIAAAVIIFFALTPLICLTTEAFRSGTDGFDLPSQLGLFVLFLGGALLAAALLAGWLKHRS